MKVLVPLLTLKENDEKFIEKLQKYDEIILLLTLDKERMKKTFGVEAERIAEGTKFLERLKLILETKGKRVFDIVEWGNLERNIKNIALLQKVKKIIIKEQKSKAFNSFIENLKAELPNVEILIL